MNHKRLVGVLKHLAYALFFFLLYCIQTDPNLFSVFGIKPLLLVPAAVVLAMEEGEFAGGLYGAAAGLLMDLSSVGLFGFHAILMLVLSAAAGLCVIYFMRLSLVNAALLTFGALSVRLVLVYYFFYAMWQYPGVSLVLGENLVPELLCTMAFLPPVYWCIRRIAGAARRRLQE